MGVVLVLLTPGLSHTTGPAPSGKKFGSMLSCRGFLQDMYIIMCKLQGSFRVFIRHSELSGKISMATLDLLVSDPQIEWYEHGSKDDSRCCRQNAVGKRIQTTMLRITNTMLYYIYIYI